MIVDGVNFNDEAIKGMSRKAFIEQNIDTFWKDTERAIRRKRLEEVYDNINPPAEKEAE